MKRVKDIRKELVEKYLNNDIVIDKTGSKIVEVLGQSFFADEEAIIGKVSKAYVKKELEWYRSTSLNVWDMPNPPKIWQQISDKDGYINSNYGWVIYHEDNGYQYKNVLRTLRKHRDSRRAVMIYNRPSMQEEYNKNGMSDFMCTNAVNYFLREDPLVGLQSWAVVQMRSNDAVFGYKNDLYWQNHVLTELTNDLQDDYPVTVGGILWNAASLHVYERHFDLLQEKSMVKDVEMAGI